MHNSLSLIEPDWPAPKNVSAYISTRQGGVSQPPFTSLNLGDHVSDDPKSVAINRSLFAENCGIAPERIAWLKQVHGVDAVDAANACGHTSAPIKADASFADKAGVGCVVMTADCMPVLFCDTKGTRVAAAHAGWRGMANGVLESTLSRFSSSQDVLAYLGPTISQAHFEVGVEVREAFVSKDARLADAFVLSETSGANTLKYMCDLYFVARFLLSEAGVKQVYGGDFCTFAQEDLFYSYRRDGAASGRLASMIYLDR